MNDYILILFIVAILYLGVRIVLKVREMNAYSDNEKKSPSCQRSCVH